LDRKDWMVHYVVWMNSTENERNTPCGKEKKEKERKRNMDGVLCGLDELC
jgi:hypothetical protein